MQIRWLNFDYLKPQSQDQDRAVADCKRVLDDQSAPLASDLWSVLLNIAKTMRRTGGAVDIPKLHSLLGSQFGLRANPDYADDWAELGKRTLAATSGITSEIDGLPKLVRTKQQDELAKQLAAEGICVLVGDSGSGKSAIAKDLAYGSYKRVIWLSNDALDYASLPDFETQIGLRHPLAEVIDGALEDTLIVFDGLEGYSTKALKVLVQILAAVEATSSAKRTRFILTVQSEPLGGILSELFNAGFRKQLPAPLQIDRLSDDEVEFLLAGSPNLNWAATNADLRTLLTNLKVLGWFAHFTRSGGSVGSPNIGLTDLIESLWGFWIGTDAARFAKQGVLTKIATLEADKHANSVALSEFDNAELGTLGTVGSSVLEIDANRVRFSHDLLSDWARLQTLIDGTWLTDAKRRETHTAPRWSKAVRLYAQRLLEKHSDKGDTWRVQMQRADDGTPTGILIRDLFLEAVFLAPNSHILLEQVWPILIADNGKLLNRLLDRFLFVATIPDPRIGALLGDPLEAVKYEHLMRFPFWPYWGPVIRLLNAHQSEVAEFASYNAAKVSTLWLKSMNIPGYTFPWRKEAAAVAIAMARKAQFDQELGPYYSAGADKVVFEALLLASAELPNEVSATALQLARRRDLDPEMVSQIAEVRAQRRKDQEELQKAQPPRPKPKPIPSLSSIRGPLRAPWADGPKDRVDKDFRTACLDGATFGVFAKASPDAALEVLLAVCIEEPQHEEYGRRDMEAFGLAYHHSSAPAFWFNGPFYAFLNAASGQALTGIIKLVNFATKRVWSRHLTFQIDGEERKWYGDSGVFAWHYDHPTLHGNLLQSALMALEKWIYDQLDQGKDVGPYFSRILKESESLAFAGLLLTIGKRKPELFLSTLRPLLAEWLPWYWDFQLTEHRKAGLRTFGGLWNSQPAAAIGLMRDWITMPHRTNSIRGIMVQNFLPLAETEDFFSGLVVSWEKELNPQREPVDLRQLIEVIRKSNYKFDKQGNEIVPVEFTLPETDRVEYEGKAQKANENILLLQMPKRFRTALNAGKALSDEQCQAVFDYIKSNSGRVAEPDEDGDEPVHPFEDTILGGVAVLLTLNYEWLNAEPTRLAWCRQQLQDSIDSPPTRSRYFSDHANGDETWEAFNADSGLALMSRNPTDKLARELVARALTPFFYSTTRRITVLGSRNRSKLGDDFNRMITGMLKWSALRGPIRMAQPNLPDELVRLEIAKADIQSSFVGGTLGTAFPDLSALNADTDDKMETLNDLRYPDGAKFRKARQAQTATPKSRARISKRRLALDERVLTAGFSWLGLKGLTVPADRAEVIARLLDLRALVFDGIPVIDDPKTQELQGLPSEFDGFVFELIAEALPQMNPSENPSDLWKPILDLGPHPHDWIERFYWQWFTQAPKPDATLTVFFSQWREMIEYALNHKLWDRKTNWHYATDGMVFELLGFNSNWTVWKMLPGVADQIDQMADLFQQAIAKWGDLPKVVSGFDYFATIVPSTRLLLLSLPWVAAAIKGYDQYDWKYGVEETVIEYLETAWAKHADEIMTSDAARNALFEMLKLFVARGKHQAIALSQRVSAYRKV